MRRRDRTTSEGRDDAVEGGVGRGDAEMPDAHLVPMGMERDEVEEDEDRDAATRVDRKTLPSGL